MKTLFTIKIIAFVIIASIFGSEKSAAQELQLEFESSLLGPVYIVDGDTIIYNETQYSVTKNIAFSADAGETWNKTESPSNASPNYYWKFKGDYYSVSVNNRDAIVRSGESLSEWSIVDGFNDVAGTDGASGMISNGEMLWLRSQGSPLKRNQYFFSMDGENWTAVPFEQPAQNHLMGAGFSGDSIIAAKSDPDGWSLWATADTGRTWNEFAKHDSTLSRKKVVVTSTGKVYASLSNNRDRIHLFKYDMETKEWSHVKDGYRATIDFAATGDTVVVTTRKNFVSISVDAGETWTDYEGGPETTSLDYPQIAGSKVYVVGKYPFAPSSATPVEGLYSVDLSGSAPTSREDELTENPVKISLDQNYPNPFNPSTNIRFDLPQSGEVQLSVYNLIGQKVATLLNRPMNAGNHTVTFDASALNSGVYFYRLSAGSFTETKMMTLIK